MFIGVHLSSSMPTIRVVQYPSSMKESAWMCGLCLCMHVFMQRVSKVAMAISPVLNRNLSLTRRCEIGIAAFLCWDLYRMLSDVRCKEYSLPKGSLFLASQTIYNLQGVCLAAVQITASKDPHWHPWHVGTARLSELSVEEMFAHIRCQSSNAQVSCRSYWKASARVCMKHGRKMQNVNPPERKPEPALSAEE